MKDDEIIMSAAEFFGETANNKGAGRMVGARSRKGRAKTTFTDIKARMVMRIYGVTRAKAEKIIAEREANPAEETAAVNPYGAMNGHEDEDYGVDLLED